MRRVGSKTSRTRAVLLDAAQQVMLDDGYAAVTYRSLADRAGVTPGLVQYYFPTLDDMFEDAFGLSTAHDEVLQFVRGRLDAVEPRQEPARLKALTARKAPRPRKVARSS